MQFNSPLPRQAAGQNRSKLLETFNYTSKSVPQNARANECNLEKIRLFGGYIYWVINLTYYAYKNAFSSGETII